ncbi:MAG: hypothetical protein LBR73_08610 [Oscillospiraceae bacterium]|jgi:formate C-acetyltransferase|nr:hypothetical protein [Oscillospiraceae bacterium]
MPSERIKQLKTVAYQIGRNSRRGIELDYLNHWSRVATAGEPEQHMRRALQNNYIFDNYSLELTEGELLAGQYSIYWERPKDSHYPPNDGGTMCASTGHRAIDYDLLLNKGVKHIFSVLDEKPVTPFYAAVRVALEGYVRFAERMREACTVQGRPDLAALFEKAPLEPCTSFHEAVQTVWFAQFAFGLAGDSPLAGRPDQYLYPFYKADMDAGHLTRQKAEEIIHSWYLKHNAFFDTWPAALMVGGTDRDGKPVWNELTEIMIEGIREVGLINPAVAVCYTEDMPPHILRLCVDLIAEGYTKPALFNDRICREGLEMAGVRPADARVYMHSTCVELTPVASSNIQVATPYLNPCKALEYVLGGGHRLWGGSTDLRSAVDIPPLDTFDNLYSATKEALGEIIRRGIEHNLRHARERMERASCPLHSAFLNDCLETGVDAGKGGARYNFYYPCFPGFITLIDSLYAIKKAVYDEKVLSLNDLTLMLKRNFADAEDVRLYLRDHIDKYGNGVPEVDAMGKDLYDFIAEECAKYSHCVGYAGSRIAAPAGNRNAVPASGRNTAAPPCNTFHPSYFAWIMHSIKGGETAATANGRKQGTALSENLGASQGCDRNSPMGIVHSISQLDQRLSIGGIATNFRFSPAFLADEEGKEALCAFIRAFMAQGNFECQFNVVNQKTLIEAQKHPEEYRTLMVRVAGYSDYFTNLAPSIQAELITRTEHAGV